MENVDDDIEPEITEASGDKFFECLEKKLKTLLPEYVKRILKLNGFNNAFMMSKLVESKISEIEEFMKNDFANFMIPANDEMDDYLGIYKGANQSKFKFLCGHKTLLDIMRDACKVYYPPVAQAKAINNFANENIDENSKNEIFQKLFDGVTNWLTSQGKFEQVLQLELNFIISCATNIENPDEMCYTMKCPIPSCLIDKTFSVIWKSYARSTKNKNDDKAPKLCPPRWFYCSLKNHFQKYHLDVTNEEIPQSGIPVAKENESSATGPTTPELTSRDTTSCESEPVIKEALTIHYSSSDNDASISCGSKATSRVNDTMLCESHKGSTHNSIIFRQQC